MIPADLHAVHQWGGRSSGVLRVPGPPLRGGFVGSWSEAGHQLEFRCHPCSNLGLRRAVTPITSRCAFHAQPFVMEVTAPCVI
jgi:hypothetical protein